jgi:hypothetical protein
MGERISFVGLDVHARQTCVIGLNQATGGVRRARLTPLHQE